MHCLLTPAVTLIMGSRRVRHALQALKERAEQALNQEARDDLHQEMLKSISAMKKHLASLATQILTMTSFGMLVPVMLLLAPLVSLLNLRAAQWICNQNCKERSFGKEVAERLLVQPPTFLIRNFGHGLSICIMIFVFIDLEVNSALQLFD